MTLPDHAVLCKTDLGRDAIQQRLPVLSVRLRPALILIDGKRRVAELLPLVQASGGRAALEELVSLGLAEVQGAGSGAGAAAGGGSPAVATPAAGAGDGAAARAASPADGEAAPGGSALAFGEFRQAMVAYFQEQLGPSATALSIQMRAAADMRALKPLIDRGLDNLKFFKGAAAVEAFRAEWAPRMPA